MDMFDMLSTRIVEHATPGNFDNGNVAATTTTMWSKQICDTASDRVAQGNCHNLLVA